MPPRLPFRGTGKGVQGNPLGSTGESAQLPNLGLILNRFSLPLTLNSDLYSPIEFSLLVIGNIYIVSIDFGLRRNAFSPMELVGTGPACDGENLW